MTREEKQAIVDELSEKFATNNFFYITDAAGLSVAAINRFRRLCFTEGMEYKVYKNTLIRKALDTLESQTTDLDVRVGFSLAFVSSPAAPRPNCSSAFTKPKRMARTSHLNQP